LENLSSSVHRLFSTKLFRLAVLFFAYVGVCEFSLRIQAITGMGTQVWPAAGIAFVCILMWGVYLAPAIFFGTLVVHLLNHDPISAFIGPAIGNTVEPLVGAYFCTKNFQRTLDTFSGIVRFVIGAVLGSKFLGAVLGVPWIKLSAYHSVDVHYFMQYWAGDALGVLLIAPPLLVWCTKTRASGFKLKNVTDWEIAGYLICAAVIVLIFSTHTGPARFYFFYPLILWVGLRLGQRGLTLVTLAIAVILIWQTALGVGPFAEPKVDGANEAYLLLFLASLQMTGLIVASVVMEADIERTGKELVMQSSQAELEKLVAELKLTKEQAEAANAAKTAFLANVSHEIRTPLGIVLGLSSELAENKLIPEERKIYSETIQRNGTQLLNVITDILDFAQVETGNIAIFPTEVSVDEIIREIKVLMNAETAKKGLKLVINREENVPLTIYTDPVRLRQVLVHVIGNAIKFTAAGIIEVSIRYFMDEKGLAKLSFTVSDTGIGIASEKLNSLFTAFNQADISSTRRYGGTGLGLALSKKIARALGGDLTLIESAMGEGSTFLVVINPTDTNQMSLKMPHIKDDLGLFDPAEAAKLPRGKTILIVDDSPDNQILLSCYLRATGAHILKATDGKDAIEKVEKFPPDLILMDLQMPGMDGYQATKELREKGFKKPIIALTAHAMKEVENKCLSSGFDYYLSKPVDREKLLQVLEDFMNRSYDDIVLKNQAVFDLNI
jgi:signal transduction histidine kinase/CheY-like chemotaxis protein